MHFEYYVGKLREEEAKEMSKPPTIRMLSLLVGTMIGCFLAYFYQTNLWMYEIELWGWWSLTALITIPALAGFIAGLIDPPMAMQNGLYTGLLSGVVNAIMASIKLIYLPELPSVTVLYGFSFFTIMSIFLWMFIASAAGLLAKRY